MSVDIYPPSQPSGMALAYAENTVGQSSITTITDLTGLTTTVTVPTGRRIRITGFLPSAGSTIAGDGIRMQIMEGANRLSLAQDHMSGTGLGAPTIIDTVVLTPTAGTHTYKLTLERVSGTGTVSFSGDPTFPAYILVEDITGTIYPAGTLVTAGIIASEAWTSWTPIITQSVTPTQTVNSGRYYKVGRLIQASFSVAFTGAGTAANGIRITNLPVAINSSPTIEINGTFRYFDTGNTNHAGSVISIGSTTQAGFVYDGFGNDMGNGDFAIANGDFMTGILIYEAVS